MCLSIFEEVETMQVLEPVLTYEGVALEVEKDISRVRFGQAGQAKTRHWRQKLEFELASLTAFQLNPRLLPYAREAFDRAPFRLP